MVTYFVLACVIRIRFVKTKLVILLPANYETRDVDAWFIVRLKLGYVSKTTPPLVWKIRESSWLFCVAFLLARRERGIQARRRRRRRNQRTCICPCGIFLVVTKSWMFFLSMMSVFLNDALINFYVVISEFYSLWNGFFEYKWPIHLK